MGVYYLRVNKNNNIRKVAIDMAYLAKHKIIRLPKYYFEDGLYLPFIKKGDNNNVEEYHLSKDKIIKEDEDFYYFKFQFKVDGSAAKYFAFHADVAPLTVLQPGHMVAGADVDVIRFRLLVHLGGDRGGLGDLLGG